MKLYDITDFGLYDLNISEIYTPPDYCQPEYPITIEEEIQGNIYEVDDNDIFWRIYRETIPVRLRYTFRDILPEVFGSIATALTITSSGTVYLYLGSYEDTGSLSGTTMTSYLKAVLVDNIRKEETDVGLINFELTFRSYSGLLNIATWTGWGDEWGAQWGFS